MLRSPKQLKNVGKKHYDVIGISLSERQIATANQYALREQCKIIPRFVATDCTETLFDANSFDIVWALESACHASDKGAFISEALAS